MGKGLGKNRNKDGITTLPLKENAALKDIEECVELLEFESSKRFGKSVCNHVVGRTVGQGDMTLGDCLTDEMKMNINMFGASVKA